MQPTQSPAPPPVTPTGNGQPQYDFIFNDNKPSKKSLLPANMSKKGRLLIIGASVLLLIMLVVIIAGMISPCYSCQAAAGTHSRCRNWNKQSEDTGCKEHCYNYQAGAFVSAS
jgi:hypothetical protein